MPAPPAKPRVLFAAPDLTGERLAEILAALADPNLARHATVLKDAPASTVLAAELPHLGHAVIKRSPAPPHARRIAARLFPASARLRSRLTRQRVGAARLDHARIPTAPVHIHTISRPTTSSPSTETLVLERLPGTDLLNTLNNPNLTPLDRAQLAVHAGSLVASFARAGLDNKDLKPSNILVEPRPPSHPPRLAVIDTVAVNPTRSPNIPRMLAALLIETLGTRVHTTRTDRLRALIAALDLPPTASRRERRDKRNSTWHAAAAIVAHQTDHAPKDNPLARPARTQEKH